LSQTESQDREFVNQLHTQAEETLRAGDVQGARQIWEAILQLDPHDAKATQALESSAGGVPATARTSPAVEQAGSRGPGARVVTPELITAEPEMDLDLDLAMATGPVTDFAADSSVPVSFPTSEGRSSVPVTTLEVDPQRTMEGDTTGALPSTNAVGALVGAAEDLESMAARLDPERTQAQAPAGSAEATLLVSRARQSLAAGRFDEAIDFASRALVIDDSLLSATRVLDGARAEMDRQSGAVERALSEAVSEIEAGRAATAIPLLEQVLVSMPRHAEAEQYLERAQAELAKGVEVPVDHGEDIDVLSAIPLVHVSQSNKAEPASEASESSVGEGIGLKPPPPPPPSPMSLSGVTGEPLPPPAALAGAMPATAGVRAPGDWKVARQRAKATGSRRLPSALLVVLVVCVLGAATWYVVRGRLQAAPPEQPQVAQRADPKESEPARPAATQAPKPDSSAAAGEEAAPGASPAVEQRAEARPESRRGDRYTKADVPRLVARADQLLAAGRAKEAVQLLQRAQVADPGNFELIEKIDRAQKALSVRRQAAERLEAGRAAFRQGQYEEALRVFYRVPEEYRPAKLDRWMANSWYNLGVRALKAGSIAEAIGFLSDGLEISPGDPDAVKHREVARRYRRRPVDDAYRIYVSNIELRSLESR